MKYIERMRMNLGLRLRAEREAQGLTLSALSIQSNVAVPNLSRIERGLADPRVSTVERIVAALGIEPWDAITPATRPTSIEDIRQRAARGRDRLAAANLASPRPRARIMRKAEAGEDVIDEMVWLAAYETETS